ncbi:unnamed protein product [Parascedosporium putredinis]|uniref:Uncharacterized protein n=1 Tax=Parascedosporium putredinis TaxID=1442378 RepID=A0A9P1H0V1_9PEZI|nr:unnamed protein product [Parascedosporium putredinis]CAI7994304.1 unnamed protein product [Parascedosporium putredinis]
MLAPTFCDQWLPVAERVPSGCSSSSGITPHHATVHLSALHVSIVYSQHTHVLSTLPVTNSTGNATVLKVLVVMIVLIHYVVPLLEAETDRCDQAINATVTRAGPESTAMSAPQTRLVMH